MPRVFLPPSDTTFLFALLLTAALTSFGGMAEADTAPETPPKQIEDQESEKEDPRPPSAHGPEYVTVKSSATADGTTHHTPGGGLMPPQKAPRAQSGITRDFIARQSPTESPVALIASLPGVIYAANDPLGTNDDQQGLSVRGLDQTEIGYLFEGVPAAPPLFLTPYTSATADTENIRSITLTQGSSDATAPLYNAVGGQLSVQMAQPKKNAGGFIDLSYGSYALNREFLRLDSGEIGHSGITSFASFSYRDAAQWRGAGHSPRYHIDSRLAKEWGQGSKTSLIFSYNWQRQFYLRAPTKTQWQANGTHFNYTSHYTDGDTAYYLLQENARAQTFIAAPTEFALTKQLHLSLNPYFIYVTGYDSYGTTLDPTGSYQGNQPAGTLQGGTIGKNGLITAVATDTFKQAHSGITASLRWDYGHNTLTAGTWYSYYDFSNPSRYAAVNAQGGANNMQGYQPILTQTGEPLTSYNSHLVQQVNALFVQERFRALSNRLTLSAAFRAIMVTRTISNALPGARYRNGASYFSPQPQVSASYDITPHDQVFINGTTGFRAPSGISNYNDRFSVSSGKQNRSATADTKPEYSIGEELGYRHTGPVNIAASVFNYNFTNRQISTTSSLNGVMVTESINGGGQTARGAQLEVGLSPWHHFSPYVSGQYIHATLDNNLRSGTDYVPTKGKKAIRTPTFSGSIGLSYDNGHAFGQFSLNYVGPTYSTFMNDERIPGFTTANLSMGYRLKQVGFARSPQIQLNLINLGQPGYLSGVNSVSFNAKSTKGIYGSTIAGRAPTYFVGGGFAGVVSVSTGF